MLVIFVQGNAIGVDVEGWRSVANNAALVFLVAIFGV